MVGYFPKVSLSPDFSKNVDLHKHLAKKIRQEINKTKINYNIRKAETFTNSSTKEWYQHINRIINNGKKSNLILHNIPNLAEKAMEEIVIMVNNHFAVICQTYPPYGDALTHGDLNEQNLEIISELHTDNLLKKVL